MKFSDQAKGLLQRRSQPRAMTEQQFAAKVQGFIRQCADERLTINDTIAIALTVVQTCADSALSGQPFGPLREKLRADLLEYVKGCDTAIRELWDKPEGPEPPAGTQPS